MTDLPVERDEHGRFVKQTTEQVRPDLEQDYHPLASGLFGWTRSSRLPLIGTLLVALVLVVSVALSTGQPVVSGAQFNMTGIYAGAGIFAGLLIALVGKVLVSLFLRDSDYYGEADSQPDDVEERL